MTTESPFCIETWLITRRQFNFRIDETCCSIPRCVIRMVCVVDFDDGTRKKGEYQTHAAASVAGAIVVAGVYIVPHKFRSAIRKVQPSIDIRE